MKLLSGSYPTKKKKYNEKILQIGEGNFIRAFVDWMIDEMNTKELFQGSVVTLQPTPRGKVVPNLNAQNGRFTLFTRGIQDGKRVESSRVVDAISRGVNPYVDWESALKIAENEEIEFIFSNTTEAGIQYKQEDYDFEQPPLSFPGKLVHLLYRRFQHFNGHSEKGWVIIPCELVENNGDHLQKICLQIIDDWQLPFQFKEWVMNACNFCNTLVDRIVPGYPRENEEAFQQQLDYEDSLMTVAEPYHLFVIEGPQDLPEKLPFLQAGLNVKFEAVEPYRKLKVMLLNGPHTMLAIMGLLNSFQTVKEAMENKVIHRWILSTMENEIIPYLPKELKSEAHQYVESVIDRFSNPFIQHRLVDISLNSVAKWQARLLPSLEVFFEKEGKLPKGIVLSLAGLFQFYRVAQVGDQFMNEEKSYTIRDNFDDFQLFYSYWKTSQKERDIQATLQKFIGKPVSYLEELSSAIHEMLLLQNREGIMHTIEGVTKNENNRLS
ncbi:tagaturonate reductase [Aneurinibacillus aneurinilyticus]|uniref:tagaturonate reductase n=1 Tax=Aneurinibacillus aneurinilyticus TaxID=1391 RepID=UPI0023F3088F|nr:tagaturonate reductase [Aneurinibacillus aneurinilyticus]